MGSVKSLTLYTSTGCTLCLVLKKWLSGKSLRFAEKDLSNTDVMSDLVMSDVFVMSAPALDVDGKLYTVDEMFDGNRLKETLLEHNLGLT